MDDLPADLNLEVQVQELIKEKTELKKNKVDLEAKLNLSSEEVRKLKTVKLDLEARLKAANVEMTKIRWSLEDERARSQAAEGDRRARTAAREEELMDEIKSVTCQLGASKDEVAMLKSSNEWLRTRMRDLSTQNDKMYLAQVKTETELKKVKKDLEKAKADKKAEEALHQIKGGFLKFATALFVYCTAMSMLKVVDPATNGHVQFLAICNMITLCSTVLSIFVISCFEWPGKVTVSVIFGLLGLFVRSFYAVFLRWALLPSAQEPHRHLGNYVGF